MRLVRSCEAIFVRERNGKEEVLCSKRGPNRHGAGTWSVPGGHVGDSQAIKDETTAEAMEREIREEVGDELGDAFVNALSHNQCAISVVDDRRADAKPAVHYLHVSFIVRVPADIQETNREPHLCSELRWFAKDALPVNELYPPHVALMQNYLAGRQYASVVGLA